MLPSVEQSIVDIRKEFPKFKLVAKSSSKLMSFLNFCIMVLSFGKNHDFMTTFTTTIGYTIYTPQLWESLTLLHKIEILRHESMHMRQRKELSFLYYFLYLMFPLPFCFAYYRLRFEQEAYTESLRTIIEYYDNPAIVLPLKSHYVDMLSGSDYCWAWIVKTDIEKWFDETVKTLTEEWEKTK